MRSTRSLITVASYGSNGSSARVRIYDWLDILGLDADRHTYLGLSNNAPTLLMNNFPRVVAAEVRLRSFARRVDDSTVLLSREATPFGRGGIESALLKKARYGVYDFDDALYADVTTRVLSFVRNPGMVWRRSVAAADTVIAGSDILAERASDISGNVVMIPSCIEPDIYPIKRDFSQSGPPHAVWLGSPSTEQYLLLIAPALLSLHRSRGLRLTVISTGNRSLGELDVMVDRVDWAPDTFAAGLPRADFGIMPLDDNEWTRGKCGYKLLQYAAAGLPLIGSAVGTNIHVLDTLGGVQVSSDADWEDGLLSLIDASDTERQRLGAFARLRVVEHFSYATWSGVWCSAVGLESRAL